MSKIQFKGKSQLKNKSLEGIYLLKLDNGKTFEIRKIVKE